MSRAVGNSHSPLKFSTPIRRKVARAAPTSPIKKLTLFSSGSPIANQQTSVTPISPNFHQPSLSFLHTPTRTFLEIDPFDDGVGHWEDVECENELDSVILSGGINVVTTTNPAATRQIPEDLKAPQISRVVKDSVFEGISFVVRYGLEILRRTMRYLIGPLSFLLFLWMLLWLVYVSLSPALHKIHTSICVVPGTSWFTMCRHWKSSAHTIDHGSEQKSQSGQTMSTEPAVDFHQVQGSIFEKLLDHASATSGEELSLGMWKVEMDTENMLAYVLKSDLESRESLTQLMETFAADVETTASILADLNSKSMSAIDRYVLQATPAQSLCSQ